MSPVRFPPVSFCAVLAFGVAGHAGEVAADASDDPVHMNTVIVDDVGTVQPPWARVSGGPVDLLSPPDPPVAAAESVDAELPPPPSAGWLLAVAVLASGLIFARSSRQAVEGALQQVGAIPPIPAAAPEGATATSATSACAVETANGHVDAIDPGAMPPPFPEAGLVYAKAASSATSTMSPKDD